MFTAQKTAALVTATSGCGSTPTDAPNGCSVGVAAEKKNSSWKHTPASASISMSVGNVASPSKLDTVDRAAPVGLAMRRRSAGKVSSMNSNAARLPSGARDAGSMARTASW